MEARTLLLGDWSRPVRDPIDLLRAACVIAVPVVWLARPPTTSRSVSASA